MDTLGCIFFLGSEFLLPWGHHFILLKSVMPSQVSSMFIILFFVKSIFRNAFAKLWRRMMFFAEFPCHEVALIFLYRRFRSWWRSLSSLGDLILILWSFLSLSLMSLTLLRWTSSNKYLVIAAFAYLRSASNSFSAWSKSFKNYGLPLAFSTSLQTILTVTLNSFATSL